MFRKASYYLAHPFDARKRVREWELRVEKEHGITLINPFYDAPERDDIVALDAGRAERYEKLNPVDIVSKDTHQIQLSAGTIAIIDGSLSYGTIMEIVYTYEIYHNPVYIICTNGHHDHPWLRYHSDRIFSSFSEFEQWLKCWQ
jgi:hypothetical protein